MFAPDIDLMIYISCFIAGAITIVLITNAYNYICDYFNITKSGEPLETTVPPLRTAGKYAAK